MAQPMRPCDMTDEQIHAAFTRLATERAKAGPARRAIIVVVADAVLDSWLERQAVQ